MLRILVNKIVRTYFHRAFSSACIQEHTIKVDKWKVNYIKVGAGSRHVLLMPGALGTIWTSFRPQIEGFDREKFTLVAWDPPGYGKSRPPDKEFTPGYYQKDADHVFQFMNALEIPKYSLIGWSDGAVAALIHAAKYPDSMEKLVLVAGGIKVTQDKRIILSKLRNINSWSESLRQQMVDIYGDTLSDYWNQWIDGHEALLDVDNGNVCGNVLKDIRCPTFAFYGANDILSPQDNTIDIVKGVAGSCSHMYTDGKHDVHIRYSDDFNRRVQNFLLRP